jgi:hypothetical protein
MFPALRPPARAMTARVVVIIRLDLLKYTTVSPRLTVRLGNREYIDEIDAGRKQIVVKNGTL